MKTPFVTICVCLIFTVLLVVLFGQLGVTGTFSEDIGGTLEAPTVWDILAFNASVFWGLLTFSIPDVPYLICMLVWAVQAIMLTALIFLIRGAN